MNRIETRARAHVAARIGAGLGAARPADVSVETHEAGVVLAGPRLSERWNSEPELRAVAAAMREGER